MNRFFAITIAGCFAVGAAAMTAGAQQQSLTREADASAQQTTHSSVSLDKDSASWGRPSSLRFRCRTCAG